MHRLFVVTAIILSLAAPAAAEDKMVVAMSKLTCSELTKLGFQDFAGVTMWLSGYYNASVRNREGLLRVNAAGHRDVGRRTSAWHQDAAAALTGAGSRDPTPAESVSLSSA